MILLAFDQATRCGWCHGEVGAEIQRISWGVTSGHLGGKANPEVLAAFACWIVDMLASVKPDRVIRESTYLPHPRSKIPPNYKTLCRLIAMGERIDEICWSLGIECREANAVEVAKFLLGQTKVPGGRNAKKAATIAAVRQLGFAAEDDNSADAIALWLLAEATYAPEASMRRGVGPLLVGKAEASRFVPA